MYPIENLEELYGTVSLLVWVTCPKCHNVSMTTTPNAENILTFGCLTCAEFESSDILDMPIKIGKTENTAKAKEADICQ